MEDPKAARGRTVSLERPVPVYLIYLTAFVRDGELHFRNDPYGKDRRALARLGKPLLEEPPICEELEPAARTTRAMPAPTWRLGARACRGAAGWVCVRRRRRWLPRATPDYETAAAADLPTPRTESASFAVKFKDEVSPHPVMALFAMPGDTVPLEVVLSDTLARYLAETGGGRLEQEGPARWRWIAPRRKGVSAIVVRDSASGESVALNAFVLGAPPRRPSIDGFHVGRYEPRALRGDPAYARPQRPDRGDGGEPRHIRRAPLHPGPVRVEAVRRLPQVPGPARAAAAQAGDAAGGGEPAGLPVTTFRIMSGYRTPYYNRSIGNETRYSRHLYGDAADIYVDEDGDGVMDDLDGDGRADLGTRGSSPPWWSGSQAAAGIGRSRAASDSTGGTVRTDRSCTWTCGGTARGGASSRRLVRPRTALQLPG